MLSMTYFETACCLWLSIVSDPAAGQPVSSDDAPAYEWEQITLDAQFAPRDGAGALTYSGRMWLLGGWNPLKADRECFPLICNNEVWSSLDGKDWRLVKPNSFRDRICRSSESHVDCRR